MSMGPKVDRELVFSGYANTVPNIVGVPMPKKVMWDDHMLIGYANGGWSVASQGVTWADGTGIGGTLTCTTSGANNDCGELYRVAHFTANKNCGMEARIKLSSIADIGVYVGFVDAVHNVNDQVNFELNSSNALVDSRATDGAAFVFDTNAGTDVWFCAGVDTNAEGTPVAAKGSLAPVANTYARLRVQLNSEGDATFYYNRVAVGFLPVCLSFAVTDVLTPTVAVIARAGAAKTLTVDRITVWQDE